LRTGGALEINIKELTDVIKSGENSFIQFKREFNGSAQLAAEIGAFANSKGGRIIVGVDDNGQLVGLDKEHIKQMNQWISNACTNNIQPQISVEVDTLNIDDMIIMIINVPKGPNKYYLSNGTDVWVKVGTDKRKASKEEMRRLLQESFNILADEMKVSNTCIDDLNKELLYKFITKKTRESIEELIEEKRLNTILENLKIINDGKCTICGLVLFQKEPDIDRITSMVKAVSFVGNEIGVDRYRDKEYINGDIVSVYKKSMSFLDRQLRKIQIDDNFNSRAVWEIPEEALQEEVVNSLVHRNYFVNMNIRIMVFDNRVEILSPGLLPNTLSVEGIKYGLSHHRNPNILSHVITLKELPYTGLGTGISRIIRVCNERNVKVDFINDELTTQFKVIFRRNINK
jgi:ATP-dependent DNA helicase RecG